MDQLSYSRHRFPPPVIQHEVVVRIAGRQMYLWRAVDHEGEVLDMLVQRRRDKRAALRLMRKLLRKQGFAPTLLTTDKLGSYPLLTFAATNSNQLSSRRCAPDILGMWGHSRWATRARRREAPWG